MCIPELSVPFGNNEKSPSAYQDDAQRLWLPLDRVVSTTSLGKTTAPDTLWASSSFPVAAPSMQNWWHCRGVGRPQGLVHTDRQQRLRERVHTWGVTMTMTTLKVQP